MGVSWMPYLLVGVGGFVGANARWLVARFIEAEAGTRFPWATFAINVSGSFLLGVLGALIAGRVGAAQADAWRLALGVGFLGAFTTFSTFGYETHTLLESGAWMRAALYMVGSAVCGLAAVRAGLLVVRALP